MPEEWTLDIMAEDEKADRVLPRLDNIFSRRKYQGKYGAILRCEEAHLLWRGLKR